jgi:AraC family transcriptional regulator
VTPTLAHLHHSILAATGTGVASRLQADELMGALVQEVLCTKNGNTAALDRTALVRYHDLIDRAKDFMHENHGGDLSLGAIAREACMSPFHFSRVFRRITGTSPHRYLTGVRLGHAALLLRDTSRSVTDICFTTGFNSLEHFIPAFRARYGMSPSAYRKAPEKSKNP